MSMGNYDCIVIGAGHNGLICAATLARRGRSVLVLEAQGQPGGAALTREFAAGFQVSGCAHLIHLLRADLVRELDLAAHGLKWAARSLPTTAIRLDGAPLAIGDGLAGSDAEAYRQHGAEMRRFAAALAPVLGEAPPRLGTLDFKNLAAFAKLGWRLRRLGRRDMRELLRIGGMNAYDLLEERFADPLLKGSLGFDAVLGTNFGPRSPGTVLTLLYRLAAESAADAGGLSQPAGGVGAITGALASAARALGAEVRTSSPVRQILVEADRASGVLLDSGERIAARAVISSADPKTTFLGLLGPAHLDTGFVRRVKHLRSRGLAAKLHLALDGLPRFPGLAEDRLRGRLLLAPSLDYLERAYNHSKYGEYSAAPAMEITIPTVNDPGLAPAGKHVISAIVQYAPYALKDTWLKEKDRFLDVCVSLLDRHAPGLAQSVRHAELMTPLDIEQEFRMSGGHWHHGDLAFDQFFMVRPVPGAAQHHTPLPGLYLCGAGCHPGGGVMGAAGRNAALQVLEAA
jgi:phytoene dehydrogenase-like protein